jgi:methylmalonyl-CoA carboxyltransferase 1.3S subunit
LKLRISIDGKNYEVDVEVAEDERGQSGRAGIPYYAPSRAAAAPVPVAPAPAAAGAPAGASASDDKVCRSPLAGIVVAVNTHPGQQIQANDPLFVLEAMKMETNVTSPITGTVKAVNAKPGEAVQAGQVLVEFE